MPSGRTRAWSTVDWSKGDEAICNALWIDPPSSEHKRVEPWMRQMVRRNRARYRAWMDAGQPAVSIMDRRRRHKWPCVDWQQPDADIARALWGVDRPEPWMRRMVAARRKLMDAAARGDTPEKERMAAWLGRATNGQITAEIRRRIAALPSNVRAESAAQWGELIRRAGE